MKRICFVFLFGAFGITALAKSAVPIGAIGENIIFQKQDGEAFELARDPKDDVVLKQLFDEQKLYYKNGASQVFFASGSTNYFSPELSTGSWRLEGGRYCSSWPPSGSWACYDLEIRTDGVVFIGASGDRTLGYFEESAAKIAAKNDETN